MKYYKLLTPVAGYKQGDGFDFEAKHLLMSTLSFQEQRQVLWMETYKEYAVANSYHYVVDGKITHSSTLPSGEALH